MNDNFGKPLYSVREYYWIIFNAFRSVGPLLKARRSKILSKHFMERIMLAVTEVNGCEACSYAHTKMALEAGMTAEEIQNMLSGIIDDVPEEEVQGVLFGQHYADTRANPSLEVWNRINEVYGKDLASGILAASRLMMWGNSYGIPLGSFGKRLIGKADPRSSLGYEIIILLGSVIMIPVGGLHALIGRILSVKWDS